ncbi:hypothetical protein [Bradyrhizobium sp. sBnM-33]
MEDRCAYPAGAIVERRLRNCRLHCCYHGSTRRS